MKKLMLLALISTFSLSVTGKVKQANEESLNDDLNFRLDQPSDREREVASDDQAESQNSDDSESERDVASENENLDAPIQYWKY